MYGLGKHRSKFGNFVDNKGIKQRDIARASEVSEETISRICAEDDYKPTRRIAIRIIDALMDSGYDVKTRDFWG